MLRHKASTLFTSTLSTLHLIGILKRISLHPFSFTDATLFHRLRGGVFISRPEIGDNMTVMLDTATKNKKIPNDKFYM